MASSASTFGRVGFSRIASRSGAIGVGELALLEVNQSEARLDFGGAGSQLPQRLVRLLRIGISSLRKGTLAFSGVLLQHGRVRLLPRLESVQLRPQRMAAIAATTARGGVIRRALVIRRSWADHVASDCWPRAWMACRHKAAPPAGVSERCGGGGSTTSGLGGGTARSSQTQNITFRPN